MSSITPRRDFEEETRALNLVDFLAATEDSVEARTEGRRVRAERRTLRRRMAGN